MTSYAYPGSVKEFSIGGGGELTATGSAPAVQSETWYEAITPDGRYLYATDNVAAPDGEINQYRIGPTGLLAALSPAAVNGGSDPTGIAVSPNGKHVYAAEDESEAVAIFNVGTTGKLTPNGSQATEKANLNGPFGVALSPDGRSLYVANEGGTTVAEFKVASNGTLSPKSTPTVAAGNKPDYVVITPDGRYAYATNLEDASISEYRVGAGGELSAQGTITGVGMPNRLYSATVSPDGQSLYAPSNGSIYQFSIGPTGLLTAQSPATVSTDSGSENLWFTANGLSAYSANFVTGTTGSVSEWDALAGGGLSAKPTPTVSSVPGAAVAMIAPDQGPVASFTAPSSAVGRPAHINGSASHDSDGTIANYAWSFGDGTTTTGSGATPTHTYLQPGHYPVVLTVSDDSGCSTSLVFTGVSAYCNGSAAARHRATLTIVAKPAASTGPAKALTRHGATLTGTVNPEAGATYRFQYGATIRFGSATAARSAGAGLAARPVSSIVSGLRPGRIYYYRLVASNAAGTTDGARRTFRTPAASAAAFTG